MSQVSRVTLIVRIKSLTDWVSEWATRSPFELSDSRTAKTLQIETFNSLGILHIFYHLLGNSNSRYCAKKVTRKDVFASFWYFVAFSGRSRCVDFIERNCTLLLYFDMSLSFITLANFGHIINSDHKLPEMCPDCAFVLLRKTSLMKIVPNYSQIENAPRSWRFNIFWKTTIKKLNMFHIKSFLWKFGNRAAVALALVANSAPFNEYQWLRIYGGSFKMLWAGGCKIK